MRLGGDGAELPVMGMTMSWPGRDEQESLQTLDAALDRLQAGNLEENLPIVDGLAQVADRLARTSAQLALAWSIAQGVVPIPGSARIDHLAENLGALDVRLSRGDLAELERVAPPGAAVGARKSPTGMELTAP